MHPSTRVLSVIALLVGLLLLSHLFAAEPNNTPAGPTTAEYMTIRWAGKENTHVIRPGGKVEFIGHELRKAPKPDRTDDRAFYMNLAINGLTKEGYEFAGMSSDEIIMKKAVLR